MGADRTGVKFCRIFDTGKKHGNGTPILSAANLVKDEPFVFAWGDDLVLSEKPFTKQLIENYEENHAPVIGVQKVAKNLVDRYGIVKLRAGTREMERVIEKPTIDKRHVIKQS